MSFRGKAIKASIYTTGGATLASAFVLAVQHWRLDEEIVCRPTVRYIKGVTGEDAELQIVKRNKYLPFTEDIVYAGVPFRALTPREDGAKALDGIGYVNPNIFKKSGPLAAFRYIEPTHCRVTFLSVMVTGKLPKALLRLLIAPFKISIKLTFFGHTNRNKRGCYG